MKSLFNCVFLLAATGVAGCSTFVFNGDDTHRALIPAISLSTCRIVCGGKSGTGFFVKKSDANGLKRIYLITCFHVIGRSGEPRFQYRVIDDKMHGAVLDGKSLREYMVYDSDLDLCVIPIFFKKEVRGIRSECFFDFDQIDSSSGGSAGERLLAGDTIYYWGYPLGYEADGAHNAMLRKGYVASYFTMLDQGVGTFLINANVYPGDSGSAVFTTNGGDVKLVGVLSKAITDGVDDRKPIAIGRAVSARPLRDLVRKAESQVVSFDNGY